jgi:hypothetical protein
MNKRQLREFALRDPKRFRLYIRGARERELTARHFLLNPARVSSASPAELEALKEYIHDRGWRSLYGHDRRMYHLLKAGAEKLQHIKVADDTSLGRKRRNQDEVRGLPESRERGRTE